MTTETLEGEAVELDAPQPRSVVVHEGFTASGALALAALPDDEFERRLDALSKGRDRVERIQKALMTKDVDYGLIPGTPKPTLYKPGAEILCQAYSLAADFTPKRTIGNGIDEPALSYLTRCDLHLGSLDGPVVAVGYGACNSWEKRYRYRNGERTCPECSQPAIIKGKEEYGGGWVCFKKKGGCGAKWPDGTAVIESQVTGQVENDDPYDLDVVLSKMSEKRAHVDATLRATNASRLFTQDVEDLARPPASPPPPASIEHFDSGLIGVASLGKPPVDGELREQPEGGYAMGFVIGEGRERVQVLAVGDLAETLAPFLGSEVVGKRVQVFGPITAEKMKVKGKDIPFSRLHLERIVTPEIVLPADSVDPAASGEPLEADSVPLFDDPEFESKWAAAEATL